MKSSRAVAGVVHPRLVTILRLAALSLFVLAVALTVSSPGGQRTEVSFRFCLRNVPLGYTSAECSVPDVAMYMMMVKDWAMWKRIEPQMRRKIADPWRFLTLLEFERRATVETAEATQYVITVASAEGLPDAVARQALELLIDAVAREVAATQPPLMKVSWPLSIEPVPYHVVTGSKEKLYRYIER